MDNQRWSHRTKDLDDLENKPNSKVMIKVDGSRRVTMRNRRFVRPMETALRPAPARRRSATPPTTRQELPRKTQLSSPPVDGNVDETPAEEHAGDLDVRFEVVHNT
jgi:hypothetical protein